MSIEDVLVELALVAVVIRQLRGRRVTALGLLWPLGLVAWAGSRYLTAAPSTDADAILLVLGVLAGAALGTGCAASTGVALVDGAPVARATALAAALWVVGVGGRLAFALVAEHGGGPAIAAFSAAHHLTVAGWTAALLATSSTEVLARSGGIGLRARRAVRARALTPAARG